METIITATGIAVLLVLIGAMFYYALLIGAGNYYRSENRARARGMNLFANARSLRTQRSGPAVTGSCSILAVCSLTAIPPTPGGKGADNEERTPAWTQKVHKLTPVV